MKKLYRLGAGLVRFLLVIVIVISGQSVLGLDVTDNPKKLTYIEQQQEYSIELYPYGDAKYPLETEDLNDTEEAFLKTLRTTFPKEKGWEFYDPIEDYGTFRINNYYVCIPNIKCVNHSYFNHVTAKDTSFLAKGVPSTLGIIGSYIDLNIDNLFGTKSEYHWIQIVKDSEKNNGNGIPFVDNLGRTDDPFYDNNSNAPAGSSYFAGTYFADRPSNSTPSTIHNWKARLYLVDDNFDGKTHKVTMYRGIRWGWKNKKDTPPQDDPCQKPENQNSPDCQKKEAKSHNDPHLVTFDGLRYDLQTVGEFILVKANRGGFEIQARQTPFNNSGSISINSAVAMKVGNDRVAFYAQHFPDADTGNPLRVNGKPVTLEGNKLKLDGGGEIVRQGNVYVVNSPTGETVLVSTAGSGGNAFFNVSPFVYAQAGKYTGLLGNVNGNPKDDQQTRGGGNVLEVQSTYGDLKQVLNKVGLRLPGVLDRAEQVYFDQLYKEFANSWRVKQEESLFDYPTGQTTKNYLVAGFPDKYLKLDMLTPEQIQNANNVCTAAKVSQDMMQGCIFDVGFSGFNEFAYAASQINDYINIVNQLFPKAGIPTLGDVVNKVEKTIEQKIPIKKFPIPLSLPKGFCIPNPLIPCN